MKSDVYFINFKSINKSILNYIDKAFSSVKYSIKKDSLVACKVHFGEPGNTTYIRPVYIRRIVENILKAGGKPFLTDTNTLYKEGRSNAVDFINSAIYNGFGFDSVGAPIIISDGLKSNNKIYIETKDSKFFKKISIGGDIYFTDEIVVVSHVKGHIAASFGGAIKNISMGFATRATKQQMHGDVKPVNNYEKCRACGLCIKYCPADAIKIKSLKDIKNKISIIKDNEIEKKVAYFDYDKCIGCADCIAVCPYGALKILWNESTENFLKKMGEVTYYFLKELNKNILYINFITDITPNCDCMNFSEYPISPDFGILFSFDPVAIDKASIDLIKEQAGVDPFKNYRPEIDYDIIFDYCEEKGIGNKNYDLINVL